MVLIEFMLNYLYDFGVGPKRDRETLGQAAGDREDVLSNCTNEWKDSNEREPGISDLQQMHMF
jgi:hypothetical protein